MPKLTNKGKAVAVGLALGSAFAANQVTDNYNDARQAEQAETAFFSQAELVEAFKQPTDPNAVANSRYGKLVVYQAMKGDTYWDVARKLGAEDRERTINEMQGQAGEVLNEGEEVILPMSQLGKTALMLDPYKSFMPEGAVANIGNNGNLTSESAEDATIQYVIPASEVTDKNMMTYVIDPK